MNIFNTLCPFCFIIKEALSPLFYLSLKAIFFEARVSRCHGATWEKKDKRLVSEVLKRSQDLGCVVAVKMIKWNVIRLNQISSKS